MVRYLVFLKNNMSLKYEFVYVVEEFMMMMDVRMRALFIPLVTRKTTWKYVRTSVVLQKTTWKYVRTSVVAAVAI